MIHAIRRLVQPISLGVLLPPLFFFGWMIFGKFTIGNDYPSTQVTEALNFRFFTTTGIEPLWFPHLSGGVPIGNLALAQIFHFPAWLISILPGYWSGNALTLITIRHLILLAACHFITFFFFKNYSGVSTSRKSAIAYLLSFICVYNLKTLDQLRYGTALDAFVYGQTLILLSLLYLRRPSWPTFFGLAVTTQFFLTAGYPPMIMYAAVAGLSGFILFIYYGLIPTKKLRKNLLRLVAAISLGFGLAAPNWVGFIEWMSIGYKRYHRPDLAWADYVPMDIIGLFSNFFRPWSVEVNSAFGASTLFSLVFSVIGFLILGRLRKHWILIPFLAFPFIYAMGTKTPLFAFFFNHVPGFSSIRVPGRIFSILPLLIFIAVTCLSIRINKIDFKKACRFSAILNISILSYVFYITLKYPGIGWKEQNVLMHYPGSIHAYSMVAAAETFTDFWWLPIKFIWIALGMVTCLGFYIVNDLSKVAFTCIAAATLIQTGMLMQNGTWVTKREPSITLQSLALANHLPLFATSPLIAVNGLAENSYGAATVAYSHFLKAAAKSANCYLPIDTDQRDKGVLLPYYLSNNFTCLKTDEEIFERLRHETCSAKSVIKTFRSDAECHEARSIATSNTGLAELNQKTQTIALTPNLAVLKVETKSPSILVTPYTFANQNWSGSVDGRPAQLLKVNGAFVGLEVPAGSHVLKVFYSSTRILWSYRIATASALICILLFLIFIGKIDRKRLAVVTLILLVTSGSAYLVWEKAYLERTNAEVLLMQNYRNILKVQLERWL